MTSDEINISEINFFSKTMIYLMSLFHYRYDFVEVFNGPGPNDPSLGRFCQAGQLITVTSISNSMFVRFRSDHSRAQGGFHIRYRAGKFISLFQMVKIQITFSPYSTHSYA